MARLERQKKYVSTPLRAAQERIATPTRCGSSTRKSFLTTTRCAQHKKVFSHNSTMRQAQESLFSQQHNAPSKRKSFHTTTQCGLNNRYQRQPLPLTTFLLQRDAFLCNRHNG
jgi:hypothetical protein